MASFVYTEAKRAIMAGEIDFDLPDDFRILLVGGATTADTEEDVNTVSAFTTLDEFVGGSYARQALAGEAISEDLVNDRAEFDATDATFTAIDTDTAQAMLLIKHVTNDTDSVPIAYIDTGGFPFVGNGGDLDITWNAEGILQLT